MILGLTGYYCAGKSTVEKLLNEQYGFYIIDMDKVGHEVLNFNEIRSAIATAFGDLFNKDGTIDRKKLGAIVFSDKEKLKLLNSIVHPAMINHLEQLLLEHKGKDIVVSAALLFDVGIDRMCDKVMVVKASLHNIISRARTRDNHSLKRILSTLRAQKLRQYINQKRKTSDIVIVKNNNGKPELEKRLAVVFQDMEGYNV